MKIEGYIKHQLFKDGCDLKPKYNSFIYDSRH